MSNFNEIMKKIDKIIAKVEIKDIEKAMKEVEKWKRT